jgi:hypothetical protein
MSYPERRRFQRLDLEPRRLQAAVNIGFDDSRGCALARLSRAPQLQDDARLIQTRLQTLKPSPRVADDSLARALQ